MPVGATVNPSTYNSTGDYVAAAKTFNGLVSTGLSTPIKPGFIVQKWYFKQGQWATNTAPTELVNLSKNGCRFYVCFFPNTSSGTGAGIASELQNLKDTIAVLKAANINFKAILCQEPNAHSKFNSAAAYKTYCSYYTPAIRAAGIKMVYDPAHTSVNSGQSSVDYYPGDALVDEIGVDYYCTSYNAGTRMANVYALASGHSGGPIPFHILEWGASAVTGVTPTLAQWHAYNQYIISFGNLTDIVLFNGPSDQTNNNILTSTDFKIPDFQAVYAAYTGTGKPSVVTVTKPADRTNNVGDAVSLQIVATDDQSLSLTDTVTGLPPGTSMTSGGLITGTLTTAGTYTVHFTATATDGSTGTTQFTWTVLTATVNTGPFFQYVQSFFGNRLTAGKANADLLLFNGNTTAVDPFISAATDARVPYFETIFDALNGKSGPSVIQMFGSMDLIFGATATIVSPQAPDFVTTLLDRAFVGQPYSLQFQAEGGEPPYFYYLPAGSDLPVGFTLSTAGVLSCASPTIPGTYTFDVSVSDSNSQYSGTYQPIYTGAITTATFVLVITQLTPSGGAPSFQISAQLLDNNLVSQGLIPFTTLTAQLFYNFVGAWALTVPYSDLLWQLISAGDWVVDFDWNGVFSFGGKLEAPGFQDSVPGTGGSGTTIGPFIKMAGADYLGLIANRIAYPDPTNSWPQIGAGSNNPFPADAIGPVPCETAIKHYVRGNVGAGAIPERRVPMLDIAKDQGRGAPVTYSAQFASGVDLNLMDIIRTLIATGGPMGTSLKRVSNRLLFDTYVPNDLSQTAWFSKALNNLTSVDVSLTDPTCTNALVRGASTLVEQNVAASPLARVEQFVDQSSSTDSSQVAQAGNDALASGAAGPSLAITATDIPYLTYGKDYNLGDLVTVEVRPGDTYTDIVTAVTLTVDPSQSPPITVVPTIGYSSDPGAADPSYIAQLLSRVRRIERRLDAQRG